VLVPFFQCNLFAAIRKVCRALLHPDWGKYALFAAALLRTAVPQYAIRFGNAAKRFQFRVPALGGRTSYSPEPFLGGSIYRNFREFTAQFARHIIGEQAVTRTPALSSSSLTFDCSVSCGGALQAV